MTTLSQVDAALEYLDRGWSVIPICLDTKRPRIEWRKYQTELPTSEEVERWWTVNPNDGIALVTGELTGLVVVDCDNEEAAEAARQAGMVSPVKVQTKRGHHLYFAHPRDGIRRGPRAGVNTRGADWPKIDGLDFRGDGGYVLLPPTKNYSWEIAAGCCEDDTPEWKDWKPSLKPDGVVGFDFSHLDLTAVRAQHSFVSEWDRTARYVVEKFPETLRIPSGMGNGRNERVMRWISECIMEGLFGSMLRVRGLAFMREFFESELTEHEFEATCRSMEEAERRNHPERFDASGEYIFKPCLSIHEQDPAVASPKAKLITMADAEDLLAKAGGREYLIEPWLPAQTIVQVYGYSGHGKSLFVEHCMAALAAGRRSVGPFEIGKPSRVLYMDFEMGMGTIARRLIELRETHGDTADRLQIWAPFVGDDEDINLRTREGLAGLQSWIGEVKPQVVVIDTVRTGYPGLQENDAAEWAAVNTLAKKLRNAGMAVILVHHANKPGEGATGREAGSTNQLTVLETQIRITQVFTDKDTAQNNAALFDDDYENPIWPQLQDKLEKNDPGFTLYMVMEVRYGKVREWTETHDRVQWIGFAQNNTTGARTMVSNSSTKQRAKWMSLSGGMTPEAISLKLGRPLWAVREWLGLSA